MKLSAASFSALASLLATISPAAAFPVTVESCGRQLTVEAPPRRAVSYGSNLTEIMLALGLEDRMAGFIGQGDRLRASAVADFPAIAGLPELQRSYPSLEVFLEKEIDFYFAGWSYGMRVGGEVTPETLGTYGIPVYELSESCVRLGRTTPPTFDYLYRDLENLAAIFGVPERAATLVADYKKRIAAVQTAVRGKERPDVFIYDSGERAPFTAGGYSMPQAIINAAGGINIFADSASSWIRVDWETMIDRNPSAIVIVDYGEITAAQKIAFLKRIPAFANVDAIRNERFLVLSYDDLTPGPRNISAAERLAEFLHDD
ncbi:iron ABC transporter substrate-binding protein [Phyllobacterium phragmitis]|uniref:Iron ABC transporter substrate-binding protein n=1 Tax=Phyllobacterium phragmitis TaxID=2670329 RepID=A0A2S9IWD0_9HYPH|nr:ABC transporter substrate-binding protein [Phyllobacterium phragmitis]PRD44832.1 iron ABC transporter substrate-binding protein [Phyllobacterium phragmitis]